MNQEKWIKENYRITEGLQELFRLNQYNASCCIVSMLALCVQQWMTYDDKTKEEFFDLVKKTWDMFEEK